MTQTTGPAERAERLIRDDPLERATSAGSRAPRMRMTPTAAAVAGAGPAARDDAIDWLRGVVMTLMARSCARLLERAPRTSARPRHDDTPAVCDPVGHPLLRAGVRAPRVIWAIGWSMVALAALSRAPHGVLVAVGAVLVPGHNLRRR
jgi:hypothetical protein